MGADVNRGSAITLEKKLPKMYSLATNENLSIKITKKCMKNTDVNVQKKFFCTYGVISLNNGGAPRFL